jgi:hypothetical protein
MLLPSIDYYEYIEPSTLFPGGDYRLLVVSPTIQVAILGSYRPSRKISKVMK